MQQLIHAYQDTASLDQFLTQPLLQGDRVLLQVFSSELDPDVIRPILQRIKQVLPAIHIIGATTAGNIDQATIRDSGLLLSFSCFEQTAIQVVYSATTDTTVAQRLAKSASQLGVVCAIAFGNTLNGTPEAFVAAFNELAPNIMIAGGSAGDQQRLAQSFVFHGDQLDDTGIVMAWLINPNLVVYNQYMLNWLPVGRSMTVTRCEGGLLYELDHQPIIEIYRHYLGEAAVQHLPHSAWSFPLLKHDGELQIARSMVEVTSDQGIRFAGCFAIGDKVKFGISNGDALFAKSQVLTQKIAEQTPIEALFVYSCTARRNLLRDHIFIELTQLNALMPIAGFFTYGEYYHYRHHGHVLNNTTTVLALSESSSAFRAPPSVSFETQNHDVETLVHLTNTTAQELNINIQFLEQYRKALDRAAIVSKADPDGNITYINRKFEDISGYTQAEVLGKNHRILRHPDTPSSVFENMWQRLKHKRPWHGVITNMRKDGSSYVVDSNITPILDSHGDLIEYISIRFDITDLKQTEEALLQAKTLAEQANKAKSDFLASMSHELRTPLNAIIGFGQLLESDPIDVLTEMQADSVAHILRAANHLLTLINEILDLAKIESGQIEFSLEAVRAEDVLSGCIELVRPQLAQQQLTLVVDVKAIEGLQICVDETRLKQVLINLLSNAIKYNQPQGRVAVQATVTHHQRLRVTVTDTGLGLDQIQLAQLFQSFNRLGAENTDIQGTGIGLVISKKIIEAMHGTIGAESVKGQGSTFWIELPLVLADAEGDSGSLSASVSAHAAMAATKQYKLLYIEDNPANLKLVQRFLSRRSDLQLISATTGPEGIAMAMSQAPDMIISDINLPELSGIELVQQLRQHDATRRVPIVALSANAMSADAEQGLAAGFDAYLTKPINLNQLLETINHFLSS